MEARALRVGPSRTASKRGPQPRFVGGSAAMQRLLRVVARVGPKDITVLVGGETGTGKELVASLVHAQSIRSSAPLVVFNCAAIPGELAEAELFGHARGAFTDAVEARRGFFAQADGGTLVLEDASSLSLNLRARLSRVGLTRQTQRVGGSDSLPADVTLDGQERDCLASTRKGTPCQREPLPGRDYCPSHTHLEETFARCEGRIIVQSRQLAMVPPAQ